MNKNIILIEDDEAFSEALRVNLQIEGFDVVALPDGKSIRKYILEHYPALMVIDYRLPGKNGADIIKEIKKNDETKKIPVILMSASQKNMQQVAKNIGAEVFLGKPFEIAMFVSLVKEYAGV